MGSGRWMDVHMTDEGKGRMCACVSLCVGERDRPRARERMRERERVCMCYLPPLSLRESARAPASAIGLAPSYFIILRRIAVPRSLHAGLDCGRDGGFRGEGRGGREGRGRQLSAQVGSAPPIIECFLGEEEGKLSQKGRLHLGCNSTGARSVCCSCEGSGLSPPPSDFPLLHHQTICTLCGNQEGGGKGRGGVKWQGGRAHRGGRGLAARSL